MDPVKKLASTFQDDYMVTITLENSPTSFQVQKALLCNTSDYFKRALDGGFKEGSDRTLRLPGCDQETFEVVLYWITSKTLPDFAAELDNEDTTFDARHEMSSVRQTLLVRTWAFGDAYLMPKLQNMAMRSLLAVFKHNRAHPEALREAFATTGAESTIRKACIMEAASDIYEEAYTNEEKDRLGATPGFLSALLDVTGNCFDEDKVVKMQKYADTRNQYAESYFVPEKQD
ncbi:hypothetical protein LTR36_010999 [Oleoguttula mirabilis]|uniref:BTB domain-containing protein n=1 Tax=Oleoguttula mirabilis TaxID=1507867 RepID=A0AAV9J527_9PEZI|nr:hypothetical protein LTR36_010999 [Oleoguttula mirabilis]